MCKADRGVESVDINVSPDKRTVLLHSEANLIAALKASPLAVFSLLQLTGLSRLPSKRFILRRGPRMLYKELPQEASLRKQDCQKYLPTKRRMAVQMTAPSTIAGMQSTHHLAREFRIRLFLTFEYPL